MVEMDFKPKYKGSYKFLAAILIISSAIYIGIGVMLITAGPDGASEAGMGATTGVLLVLTGLLWLVSMLNSFIRRLKISGGVISVSTMLGATVSKPFLPYAYYERGRFLIAGRVFGNAFMKNGCELDFILGGIASQGGIAYLREQGFITNNSWTPVRIVTTVFCFAAGVILGITAGTTKEFSFVTAMIFIFAVSALYFAATFYKLPKTGKRIWMKVMARLYAAENICRVCGCALETGMLYCTNCGAEQNIRV